MSANAGNQTLESANAGNQTLESAAAANYRNINPENVTETQILKNLDAANYQILKTVNCCSPASK